MIHSFILNYLDSMRIQILDTHGNTNTICIIIKCNKDLIVPLLQYEEVQDIISTVKGEYHYVLVTPC